MYIRMYNLHFPQLEAMLENEPIFLNSASANSAAVHLCADSEVFETQRIVHIILQEMARQFKTNDSAGGTGLDNRRFDRQIQRRLIVKTCLE